jgi:hypothetical protein
MTLNSVGQCAQILKKTSEVVLCYTIVSILPVGFFWRAWKCYSPLINQIKMPMRSCPHLEQFFVSSGFGVHLHALNRPVLHHAVMELRKQGVQTSPFSN